MSTEYRMIVTCDEHTAPDCTSETVCCSDTPKTFDTYATDLWAAGWFRGFRYTGDPAKAKRYHDYRAYDVCPQCQAALPMAQPTRAQWEEARSGD